MYSEKLSFLSSYIKKQKKLLGFGFSIILVILLGITDYISGYELSFSIFYLIPISITVIFTDFKYGFIVSLLSAICWCFADMYSGHVYSSIVIPVWNSLMRLGYFLIHSFLLSKFIKLYKKVRYDSLTDSLTNTINSRYFHELFSRELKKVKRTKQEFTLVCFDLDNFKLINDTYGHLVGDHLLRLFSDIVSNNIRPSDIFARLGGDEFILLLPETDFYESNIFIKRIKETVENELSVKKWPVTLSIGAVTFRIFNLSMDEMQKKTDGLMYEVKGKGKNDIRHIIWE